MAVADVQDLIRMWARHTGSRSAYLRWDAVNDKWTVSAHDKDTGDAFAISGTIREVATKFIEWKGKQ